MTILPASLKQLHTLFRQKASDLQLQVDCLSSGPLDTDIAFISTAPGQMEVSTGIPFSGPAGGLLWSCCHKINLNRNKVYVTNVIKRVVSARDGEEAGAITPAEFNLYAELLKWELSLLPNLRYILILGNEALDALRPNNAIAGKVLNWRGSWISGISIGGRPIDGLVTVNPALVARCNRIIMGQSITEETRVPPLRSAQKIFENDLRKFSLLTQGKLTRYDITHHINPTLSQALEFLRVLEGSTNPISYDIETSCGETACIGFGLSRNEGMCIPFINSDHSHYWSFDEEKAIRIRAAEILSRHNQTTAQFCNFDNSFLWHMDGIRAITQFDTLLAHHTLYPTLPHSLEFLCSVYTTHPYYKSEKDDWRAVGDIDRFWQYNVKDCCITLAVREGTTAELRSANLLDFFLNHVMRATPHLGRMCEGGVKIDVDYKEALRQKMEVEVNELLTKFHASVASARDPDSSLPLPNPRSHKALGQLFFQELKLVGRGTSTNAANRKRMASHPRTDEAAKAIISSLDDYAKAAKFFSTYVEADIDPDGRYRCTYLQSGTQSAPGRLSSSQTAWGTGGNLQNQPHAAHSMFVTEPGYCFIYFDLEQAEARVVGWEANIPKWIEDFERARIGGNYDCHRALCADMWNIPYSDTPSKDVGEDGKHTLRYIAKRCRHGLNYRMHFIKLAEVTGLSLAAAQEAYTRYHRITPELRVWWDSLTEEVKRNRVLYSAMGRRWVLTEPLSEMTLESIVAFKPQSTIGDKVLQVIYQAEDDDDWPHDARICMNIHDALIGIAPIAKADTCLRIMRKYAEQPIYIRNQPPLIIPTSLAKTTSGTLWRLNADGEFEFHEDPSGFHRWSNLQKVQL